MLQDDAKWGRLSPELLELILDKYEQGSSLQAYLELQLVSRSWNAAAKNAFKGSLEFTVADPNSTVVSRICRLLPNVSKITIETAGIELDLSAISALSHLTEAHLSHHPLYNHSLGIEIGH